MSPEQLARHAMRIDRRTDVWSLGVCLFEAVTLRRPFEAPTREALCQAILTESPPAPRRLAPAVPEDLSVVLETALEKDLDRRYRTAAAFADDLRAVLEHRPVAAKPIGPVGRLLRWAAREPAKAALLATVLVALPAISTLIALRINDLPRLEAHRAAEAQQRRDDEIAQGLRAGDEGAVEQAIRHYRAALEIDAGSVEAVIAMAIAQSGLGRKREALQTLEANAGLVGARRGAVALRRQLLRELEGTADDGSLLPECQDALDHFLEGYRLTHPADERDQEACKAAFVEFMSAVVLSNAPRKPYYTFALDAAARVKDTTAVRMLSDGLRHFWPGSASTHHALGVASFLAGRLDESLAEFVEAARLMPHHSMYRFALGKVYFHKGMLDESIAELRRSIELNRSYATSHDLLAHVLERKGSVDEALQEYRLAYGFDHDRKSFWTLLDALLRHRRLDQAAALYRDAAPRFSKDDDLHYGVGCTFGSAGLRTDAVKAYEKALEIRPDHVEAHINLGLALFNSGQSEAAAAIDHYRTAMRLRPSDIRIYPNFGLALMESGRVDEAIGVLRAGLGVKPDAAEVHCTLGRALMKHGEFEAALESMRRGHELGTNYPDWPYPSEEWVRRLDEMVAEERRMLRVAEGKETANGPADILRLAELAHDSRRWSLAANWYVSFPDGEHPLQPDQALKAAHAAVQAATGARTDSQVSTTPATALHWRAREWLTRQLDTYGEVQKVAELLLSDPLYTSVRDEPSLSGLPPEEARAWREFWAEVRAAAR
jgi:tetratricopeptide (TPR) repeat protein